jgi:hypothetical protein
MAADNKNILSGIVRVFFGNPGNGVSPDALPANTVAFGAAWTGAWREVGFTTDEGVHLILEQTFSEVAVAQQRSPALLLPTAANDRVTFTMLESTLENLRDALGRGAITTIAAASGTPGQKELTISEATTVQYVAVGFEGVAPPNTDGMPRRVLIPTAMAVAAVDLQFTHTVQQGIPVELRSLVGDIVIRDVLQALP